MSAKQNLDNGTRISRREALGKSLYGASGLLLGSRLATHRGSHRRQKLLKRNR